MGNARKKLNESNKSPVGELVKHAQILTGPSAAMLPFLAQQQRQSLSVTQIVYLEEQISSTLPIAIDPYQQRRNTDADEHKQLKDDWAGNGGASQGPKGALAPLALQILH